MNVFTGIITKITSEQQLSLIQIEVGEITLSSIVVDTPETAPHLKEGATVDAVFKETEVVIALDSSLAISLRNQIKGKVHTIDEGTLLSRIAIKTSIGLLKAIITTNACKELELKSDLSVIALIKTNEMMLSYGG